MRLITLPFNPTIQQIQDAQQNARQTIGVTGTGLRPDAPQNVIAQPGSRKVVLTWHAPESDIPGGGYKIYVGDESTLYQAISDPTCRRADVNVSAGSPSPTNNFFVSRVDASGIESAKVWTQGKATDEAGAPADPPPPTGWTSTGGGGSGSGGTGGSFCFSGNTMVKTPKGVERMEDLPDVCIVVTRHGLRIADHIRHNFQGMLLDMGNLEGVVPSHLMWSHVHGGPVPASKLFTESFQYNGVVHNLSVRTEIDDEKYFVLGNGWEAHNMKAKEEPN